MKKCYIAGMIGNLSKDEYEANFKQAEIEVTELGFKPVSPISLPHDHDKSWCAYMREDLSEMLKCDTLYALRNWRQSPGATIEINLALSVGINIIHQK